MVEGGGLGVVRHLEIGAADPMEVRLFGSSRVIGWEEPRAQTLFLHPDRGWVRMGRAGHIRAAFGIQFGRSAAV
jgi:hypothetical protein